MFSRWFQSIRDSVVNALEKQLFRASLVVPIVLCVGYLLAGLTTLLSEWYGLKTAYFLMAAAMAVLAAVAFILLSVWEKHDEAEAEKAQKNSLVKAAAHAVADAPAMISKAMETTTNGPAEPKPDRPIPLQAWLILLVGLAFLARSRFDDVG